MIITLGNLVICGFILGYIFPEHPTLSVACTVAFLPIIAIVDWQNSHNLIPFEFGEYHENRPYILSANRTSGW